MDIRNINIIKTSNNKKMGISRLNISTLLCVSVRRSFWPSSFLVIKKIKKTRTHIIFLQKTVLWNRLIPPLHHFDKDRKIL